MILSRQVAIICALLCSAFSFNRRCLLVQQRYTPSIRKSLLFQLGSKRDDLNSLKIDESKLSDEEKERLQYIQKITAEADEMVKNAGFTFGDDNDEVMQALEDTNWSGQSDLEIVKLSQNSPKDLLSRWGLGKACDSREFLELTHPSQRRNRRHDCFAYFCWHWKNKSW